MARWRRRVVLTLLGALACGGTPPPTVEPSPVGPLGDVVDFRPRLPPGMEPVDLVDEHGWPGTIHARGCDTEVEVHVWTTAEDGKWLPDKSYAAGFAVRVTANDGLSHVTWALGKDADPASTLPFTVTVECVVESSRVVWEYQGYLAADEDFVVLHEGVPGTH